MIKLMTKHVSVVMGSKVVCIKDFNYTYHYKVGNVYHITDVNYSHSIEKYDQMLYKVNDELWFSTENTSYCFYRFFRSLKEECVWQNQLLLFL